MNGITPGFILLQSNELDALRQILVEWLKRSPLPALVDETVLVQSNGMAQWLRLGLCQPSETGGLGVALGVSFEFPARVQWRCYRSVLGAERVPEQAPFDKTTLRWRLMRLLPNLLSDPRFGVFHRQLTPAGGGDAERLFDLCSRLADQWDEYQVYRADWLSYWAAGHDDLPAPDHPMPKEAAWQPVLWRALLADVAERFEPSMSGRAGLHHAFMTEAKRIERPADFPPRFVVFGVSSLPPQVLDVLSVAAKWSQVIVCIQNPCQVYWADMVPAQSNTSVTGTYLKNHPLLALWGRQGRDLLRMLSAFEEQARAPAMVSSDNSLFIESEEPRNILQKIQHDILHGRPTEELLAEKHPAIADASLVFHVVHSPLRAVEVLHDQLLAALADDPSLAPQQIIVMVPDIALFAPAIHAIFGRFSRDDPRYIPFAIADQPDQTDHALLSVFAALFSLPQCRFERSELLDWLSAPAVRAAFALSAADVDRLAQWLDRAAVHWGLDVEQRTGFEAPAEYTQHSWQFGLDRLYLGYLNADAGALWQGIAPLDAIDASQAELIGRLHEFLNALAEARKLFAQSLTPLAWGEALNQLLPRFFQDEAGGSETARWVEQIRNAVISWQTDCALAEWQAPLPAGVVQSALFERLAQPRLSQRFLVGGVNFATLMPMRAIPYRQVYLLGMDEHAYPRRQPRQDFDLLADRYRPGDRARRDDDRYLFLEALLAAREKLSISWIGRAVKDNSPRSPSIVVQQLMDYLDHFWEPLAGRPLRESLTTVHPLHPFSADYFEGKNPALFTFDPDWRRVHDPDPLPPSLSLPRWLPEAPCRLADLAKFLKNPLDPLMRLRFGIGGGRAPEEILDHEPFTLDGLTSWQIRHELAQQLRAQSPEDADLDQWFEKAKSRWMASGSLPWRYPAWDKEIEQPLRVQWRQWRLLHDKLGEQMDLLIRGLCLPKEPAVVLRPESIAVRVCTQSGKRIHLSWVDSDLYETKNNSRTLRYEKFLDIWPVHLAAQMSGTPVHTYVVAKGGVVVCLPPMSGDEAERQLTALLDYWFLAAQEPLPVAPLVAIEYANADSAEMDRKKLDKAYAGDPRHKSSDLQKIDALARFWPDLESLLLAESSPTGQRFTDLAKQLYAPMVRCLSEQADASLNELEAI